MNLGASGSAAMVFSWSVGDAKSLDSSTDIEPIVPRIVAVAISFFIFHIFAHVFFHDLFVRKVHPFL